MGVLSCQFASVHCINCRNGSKINPGVSRSDANCAAPQVATAARPVIARRQVAPKAFFGFGSKSSSSDAAAAPQYYICIDCGYIYDGDFKKAPSSYRCPVCSSPKNR